MRETVLYYNPKPSKKSDMVKGVLICLGMRIRNISADQVHQKVGYLAGLPGFEAEDPTGEQPVIEEEVMVLQGFSDQRLNELLYTLKKAEVPRVNLKAVLTENNRGWSFYELYEELKREHEAMEQRKGQQESR